MLNISFYRDLFRDAYERAYGVRPVFSLDYLTAAELQWRTAQIKKFSGVYS
jgi:hypothetical protein